MSNVFINVALLISSENRPDEQQTWQKYSAFVWQSDCVHGYPASWVDWLATSDDEVVCRAC